MITDLKTQLERDEGRRNVPYQDSMGWWTIGIGHYLGTKDYNAIPPQFQRQIDDFTIDALFSVDLHHIYDLMDIDVPWWSQCDGQDGPRSGVLLNMAFNLGVHGLASFTTFLGLMKIKDWASAAADLAQTAVYHELPERYGRLRQQILSGQWQ